MLYLEVVSVLVLLFIIVFFVILIRGILSKSLRLSVLSCIMFLSLIFECFLAGRCLVLIFIHLL